MPYVLMILLCVALLTSCVSARDRYNADIVNYWIEQSMHGIPDRDRSPMPMPISLLTPPPAPALGPSAGQVLGAIVVLPLLLSLDMLSSTPYRYGTHCYTYTYKDQYHARCD